MKSAIDGLVDAGVLSDDNKITYLPVEFSVSKTDPKVVITVEKVSCEQESSEGTEGSGQ